MTHRWPPRSEWQCITAHESRDGNEHHIRQCMSCNITKITIIPPNAFESWHEWITESGREWVGEITPPCIPKGVAEAVHGAPAEVPFS